MALSMWIRIRKFVKIIIIYGQQVDYVDMSTLSPIADLIKEF